MNRACIFLPIVGILALAAPAGAQSKRGKAVAVIEMKETTVVGRVQKPVAAQEIGKFEPRLQANEPKKSFLDRIESATSSSPF